jgi:hypothetical protein
VTTSFFLKLRYIYIFFSFHISSIQNLIQVTGHGLLAFTLWRRAQQFDIVNKECITPFYMFIWKVCKSLCFVISVRLLSIFKERKDLLMCLCLLICVFFNHFAVILRRVFSYTICVVKNHAKNSTPGIDM